MERGAVSAAAAAPRAAVDAHVEMVAMRMAFGRLHQDALGAGDHRRRCADAPPLREESPLESVGDEDELHPRFGVRDEPRDELPIADVVEAKADVGPVAAALIVEVRERPRREGLAATVEHE